MPHVVVQLHSCLELQMQQKHQLSSSRPWKSVAHNSNINQSCQLLNSQSETCSICKIRSLLTDNRKQTNFLLVLISMGPYIYITDFRQEERGNFFHLSLLQKQNQRSLIPKRKAILDIDAAHKNKKLLFIVVLP